MHSRDRVMHIASSNIKDGKLIKTYMSILFDMFPEFAFGPDARKEEHNDSP